MVQSFQEISQGHLPLQPSHLSAGNQFNTKILKLNNFSPSSHSHILPQLHFPLTVSISPHFYLFAVPWTWDLQFCLALLPAQFHWGASPNSCCSQLGSTPCLPKSTFSKLSIIYGLFATDPIALLSFQSQAELLHTAQQIKSCSTCWHQRAQVGFEWKGIEKKISAVNSCIF